MVPAIQAMSSSSVMGVLCRYRTFGFAAKNAAAHSTSGEEDPRAELRKAWEKATALRRLWEAADNGTREWFMGVVWFDPNQADHRAIESSDEPANDAEDVAARL